MFYFLGVQGTFSSVESITLSQRGNSKNKKRKKRLQRESPFFLRWQITVFIFWEEPLINYDLLYFSVIRLKNRKCKYFIRVIFPFKWPPHSPPKKTGATVSMLSNTVHVFAVHQFELELPTAGQRHRLSFYIYASCLDSGMRERARESMGSRVLYLENFFLLLFLNFRPSILLFFLCKIISVHFISLALFWVWVSSAYTQQINSLVCRFYRLCASSRACNIYAYLSVFDWERETEELKTAEEWGSTGSDRGDSLVQPASEWKIDPEGNLFLVSEGEIEELKKSV